jgi:nitrite reductase (NADH) small subunit
MRVVHLEDGDNYIEVGAEAYLVLQDPERGCRTVRAKCRHRGGPLHLGLVDDTGHFIVCPWHQTRTGAARLFKEGLPTVRSGRQIAVVVRADPGVKPQRWRRTTLIDCAALLAGGAG